METQTISMELRAVGFAAIVERAYRQPQGFAPTTNTIEGVISRFFAVMAQGSARRDAFKELLLHVYSQGCYQMMRNPEYIKVLANMSVFGNKMVRPVHAWKKQGFEAESQLASLIRYCFARYEVPGFMEFVFSGENKVHMLWYVQLGRGVSVQDLSGFPVKFTKRMAHEFRLTSGNFTVERAIRRAQALGFGATPDRADAIAWTALSDGFGDENFRTTLVKFFAGVKEHAGFDQMQVILEYVFTMHEANKSFSMKGRTWAALARQSAEWMREMAKKKAAANFNDWKPATIQNYKVQKGESIMKIVQLTNSEALYEEGYEMSHCVADYEQDCYDGLSAIFSLREFKGHDDSFDILATIEVELYDMSIVQAKAKYNAMICSVAHEVIVQWAAKEKLITDYDYYESNPAGESIQLTQNEAVQQVPVVNGPLRHAAIRHDKDSMDMTYMIIALIKIILLIAKCSHAG